MAGLSISRRKGGKDNTGKIQGNLDHNNMKLNVPHARKVDNPIYTFIKEDYKKVLTNLMQKSIEEYNKRERNKSRRYDSVDDWFRRTFGVGIEDNSAKSILEATKKRGGKNGVKSFSEEIVQIGDMFDCGYIRPTQQQIDLAVKRAKSEDEEQEIKERAKKWSSENSKKCEEILKLYVEGCPDLNIPSIQERNPNFKYFNGVLHRAETTPHLHLNYIAYGENCRGISTQINYDKALRANLEYNGIKINDDKGNPINGMTLFRIYNDRERDILRNIAEFCGVDVKDKDLEICGGHKAVEPVIISTKIEEPRKLVNVFNKEKLIKELENELKSIDSEQEDTPPVPQYINRYDSLKVSTSEDLSTEYERTF